VEGVTFLYGAFWTITPTYCDGVIVRNVRIVTEGEYGHTPNGDGVNPSSSRNILIENCEFDTGDDCVAIKAGRDNDGLRVNIPTENVVIRNCRGLRGHGGIVIGSETSGGVRNVYAADCSFRGTDRIVRIKTARGRGGVIENLWFSRLTGDEIGREAIHINMLYTGARLPAQPVTSSTPAVRNVFYEDISCTSGSGYAIELLGLPEQPVENVTLTRISAAAVRGVNIADARGILMTDVTLAATSAPVIRILDGESVRIEGLRLPRPVPTLAEVTGPRSRDIRIGTGWTPDASALRVGPDVAPGAVTVGPAPRGGADTTLWSRRIADSFLRRHPGGVTFDSLSPDQKWNYEQGLMLIALLEYGQHSGDPRYFEFVKANLDLYVDSAGSIRTYKRTDYNLDNIGPGKALLAVHEVTRQPRYRWAADSLLRQLQEQPRTREGGFWHKKIYPYQMWLDGLFMAQPFRARYAAVFDSSGAFDDIADQFIRIDRHTYDSTSGLFYHAWSRSFGGWRGALPATRSRHRDSGFRWWIRRDAAATTARPRHP
ncbi:MAG: glycoside hydrolase family 28, partial [Bacteroidetes bacterium]|nr:glycoside hydrolase family 28 [Bacteroidota bacterium]